MAEMIRLRELAALLKPPMAPVQEAKTKASDFEGIQNVVQDALADLHDKLAEGGALEALVDSVGLTDLDKQKDKDGFTILEKLDHITAQYKKEVEKLMMEIEGMMISMPVHEDLNEMAAAASFSSGWIKGQKAKDLVAAFKNGDETFDLPNGDKYKAVKTVPGNKLEKDQIVFASYNGHNQGANLYKILGFTGDDKKYGEGGVKFSTAKEMLDHYKVGSLKALDELQDKNEYGKASYMVVKDLDGGDEGPFFYLFNGRWSIGSGADALSFKLVEKV